MTGLSESVLKQLIKGGETNTVELKAAAPRPVEMAERLCGLANARGGIVIIGVEDSKHKIVGVPDDRMAIYCFCSRSMFPLSTQCFALSLETMSSTVMRIPSATSNNASS